MNSVIFAHHHGQFYNPDTNSKVAIELGKKLFIEMIHDVSKHTCHYLPKILLLLLLSYCNYSDNLLIAKISATRE